ncbi:MAG: transporter [Chitinophagaceae bacterium]
MKKKILAIIVFLSVLIYASAQVLETEDSRPLNKGQVEVGTSVEYQTSREGHEIAFPLSFEYGISKRFTFLLEPVPYTGIYPKTTRHATGFGDLELTLFYQVFVETKRSPSISLSAEVKIPAAKNSLIGTGKTDFTPFFIASKTTGKFFSSLNLSYTFLGKPKGTVVDNLFNYALGTVYQLSAKSVLFTEIYGNTSAFGGSEVIEIPGNPQTNIEISGGETVASVGYGCYLNQNLLLSFGISYDNNHALLFRPGIVWTSQNGKKLFSR